MVEELVDIQGDPKVFYSSFLELNRRNLVSTLAFDSRAVRSLLKPEYDKFFIDQEMYPIFYANTHPITGGNYNAIDVALDYQ